MTKFNLGEKLTGIKPTILIGEKPSAGINEGYLPRHSELTKEVPAKITGSTVDFMSNMHRSYKNQNIMVF